MQSKDTKCQQPTLRGICGLTLRQHIKDEIQHDFLDAKPTEATFSLDVRLAQIQCAWHLESPAMQASVKEARETLAEQQREIERLRAIETRAKERCSAYGDNLPIYRDKVAMARYILEGGEIA